MRRNYRLVAGFAVQRYPRARPRVRQAKTSADLRQLAPGLLGQGRTSVKSSAMRLPYPASNRQCWISESQSKSPGMQACRAGSTEKFLRPPQPAKVGLLFPSAIHQESVRLALPAYTSARQIPGQPSLTLSVEIDPP